jgi:DNA-binding NarL/FixJ family response regulator
VATRLGGIDELTPREMDVLRLLAEGLPNRKIGERLAINERTVKYHVAAILAKLEAANRTEAVMRAIERGLITLEG